MPTRGSSAVLLASIALVGFWAAGCGGTRSSTAPSPAARTRTSSSSSSGAVRSYHAGQLCSGRSEPVYAAQSLTCITGRLQQASAARYQAGQFCSGRSEPIYAASGLKCVQGRLQAK